MLTAALLGALFAHGFVLMREGNERKRRFRTSVELVLLEIEAAPKDIIWDVHHNSIVPLREQAAHVLLDIRHDRRKAFRENLIKYSKLARGSLPNFVNVDTQTLNPEYEAAVASIIGPLENLLELADGQRGGFRQAIENR